ncbi:MBL fold metallo-hydrolase [Candidatus Parcubacteria bacterium]|nr:MAG: MBL fold metallo-hydrolase [Candidatus Parcubacteria bacterium]
MITRLNHWRWLVVGALGFAALAVWSAVFALAERQDLTLTVLDIGQGEALFIDAGNGVQVLIDGGPSDAILEKLGTAMPFWDRTIELVVLTHPHADHVSGLVSVLDRYRVGMVIDSGVAHEIADYAAWQERIRDQGIVRHVPVAGERIRIDADTVFEVLAPLENFDGRTAPVHDAMVVLRLVDAGATALLTGDAEADVEAHILSSGGIVSADLLKVGHHGSKTSTSARFLEAVRPAMAAMSLGAGNRYGHPHPSVVSRLEAAGVPIYRTDRRGDCIFTSTGESFAVRCVRENTLPAIE